MTATPIPDPTPGPVLRRILVDQFRILTFQPPSRVGQGDRWWYLGYVVLITWIVGIGRYWDSPDALAIHHTGLGSVLYLFAMSALLWAIIRPIARRPLPYTRVLLFVGMTSAPALLYAIPVEGASTVEGAQAINLMFLLIVAVWRVALLYHFVRHVAGLTHWLVLTVTFLPLTGIMIVLSHFSLEHVTFQLMAGIQQATDVPHTVPGMIAIDASTAVGLSVGTTQALSFLSWIAFPALLVLYLINFLDNFWARRRGSGT